MPTHYEGTARERRALDAFIKLARAKNSIAARLWRRLLRHDLTENQFGVLELLLHLGPQCQRAMGTKLLTSGANITVVVDNLEKRALVRRTRDARDRRFVTVALTATGKRLIERIFPGHVAAIVEELRALTPAEQEELGRLCKKLGLAGRETR